MRRGLDPEAVWREQELKPARIAAAHHISVRYLHKLFEDQQMTVSAWIRELRLGRAYRDLTDPTLLGQPVHAIAARWGFGYAGQFNRAFRARYGYPPSECRRRIR